MSGQVIVYIGDDDEVCTIHVNPNYLDGSYLKDADGNNIGTSYTMEQFAQKDVPHNKKYKIINISDLPDEQFRNAWEIAESELTDGVGAESTNF
tara:strand:+ start:1011 stop:1292 length:282 start_codon:yes stop_codon:yes gene_type:complete